MSLITIDFETFYSKEFTLSKLTTEAYVRSPEFETIGFSYKIDYEPPVWVSDDDDFMLAKLLALDLPNNTVLAHNMAFDGFILAERYGIRPKFMLDTLSMARPICGLTVGGSLARLAKKFNLGEKGTAITQALGKRRADFSPTELAEYGDYCNNDNLLCFLLYQIFRQWTTPRELYVIDLLLRMFTDPVLLLDPLKLDIHLKYIHEKRALLLSRLSEAGVTKKMLMSNSQLAQVLTNLGVDPPMKLSPAALKKGQNNLTYAFSKVDGAFKDLLEHPNEAVQAVVAARLGVKSTIEETRTQRLMGVASRGTLPVPLGYWAAHTGRAGGRDGINLQNVGRTSPIRQAIKAPAGYLLMESDSSQIEARILPWWAGQDDLVADFAAEKDVYAIFASAVYNRPITRADKAERFLGKTCILGLGYGTGPDKLHFTLATGQEKVDLDPGQCDDIVKLYRAKYSKISDLWDQADKAIHAMSKGYDYELGIGIKIRCVPGGVHLPNGTMLRYPNLRRSDEGGWNEWVYDSRRGPVKLYGAKLVENITQALARIIVFYQMCKIDQRIRRYDMPGRRFKVVLTVHDSVVVMVPEAAAEQVKAFVIKVMSTPPKWAPGLPLACECHIGPTYGDLKG